MQILVETAAFLWMLILILDGKTALEGARIGIDLCLKTVIPSLFPFFVLSILLTNALSGTSLGILRPIQNVCGLGSGTESILISGFLGGYPVGAQSIATAWQSGKISKQEAERILSFCNNAGPAFLFGMVGSMFSDAWTAWSLWGIHILSALMTARCFPGQGDAITLQKSGGISISQALNASLRVMAVVCGWVVLFRVLIAFLKRWVLWILPIEAQTALIGLLELSNGCCELILISDIRLRYLICSGMLAFGGLCVTMQTAAVTNGLSLGYYLRGKLLQTAFSLMLSYCVISGAWYFGCFAAALILLFPWKKQKKSSIRQPLGV